MKEIKTMQDLQERIKELEVLEASQIILVRSQASATAQGLRPSNLLKNAFSDVVGSDSIKKDILKASIGVGTGMLIKRMFTSGSKSLLKKAAGFGLQFITAKAFSKKIPVLKKKITAKV